MGGLDDNSSFEGLQCDVHELYAPTEENPLYRVATGTPAPTDPTHNETNSRENYTFFHIH